MTQDAERRFSIVTYGCQMNVHDSEKLSNLLHHAGLSRAPEPDAADLLVINTCSIRDKAENQLYSDLGRLKTWKEARPGRVLGVGGCVAQQVGDGLLTRFPQLDFVFGTHNLRLVPSMIESASAGARRADTSETRSLARFDLPSRHPSLGLDWEGHRRAQAFVTVMEGCDMFCTFCIVPMTRGREISRVATQIEEEVRGLVDDGVREITLLGQTVNAYGRHDVRRGKTEAVAGTVAFAELLRRLDRIQGLDRIRYTSPHPLFFDDALVRAHADLESLCPHVHLPLQSGSTKVLERMRRRYTRDEFLEIPRRLRAGRSDIAITTDVIVGFPGETRAEFEETLTAMEEAGFVDSYSFKYSPRPGTAALDLGEAVPGEEAQDRLQALQAAQRSRTLSYHRSRVGTRTRILIEGESRRGSGQICGRDPFHRVVNVEGGFAGAAAGEFLDVDLVEATPNSLIGERDAPRAADPSGRSGGIGATGVKQGPRSAEETGRSGTRTNPGADGVGDPLRVL